LELHETLQPHNERQLVSIFTPVYVESRWFGKLVLGRVQQQEVVVNKEEGQCCPGIPFASN